MRDSLFSMKRSKYGRPRPSRRRTAPGGETATGTGRCDIDDVDHIDDVKTEWPHQNSPCIKMHAIARWEFRSVLYSRYLVELRKPQQNATDLSNWIRGSRSWRRKSGGEKRSSSVKKNVEEKNFGQQIMLKWSKMFWNLGIAQALHELNVDRLTTHLHCWLMCTVQLS